MTDRTTRLIPALISALSLLLGACGQAYTGEPQSPERLYHQAESLYLTHDYAEAISLAMLASLEAEKEGAPYLAGRAEDLCARLTAEVNGGNDIAVHRLNAAKFYLEADSINAHRYALVDAAIAYINDSNTSDALSLLDSIRNSIPADTALTETCLRLSVTASIYGNALYLAENYQRQLENLQKIPRPDATDCANKAVIEIIKHGRTDKTDSLIGKAWMLCRNQHDSIAVSHAASVALHHSGATYGNPEDSSSIKKTGRPAANSDVIISFINAQKKFLSHKAAAETETSREVIRKSAVAVVIALLAISALYIVVSIKIRRKNREISVMVNDISRLANELTDARNATTAAKSMAEANFHDKWQTLNLLCNEFFEKGMSEKTRATIVGEIEKEINRMQSDKEMKVLEHNVNRNMDDIVAKLRSQCGDFIKEDDILFLTLIYAGFSPRAVCLFTGIKLKYYYTKRARLTTRILASDAKDKEWFAGKIR